MSAPLFRRLLGPATDTLAPPLRAAHDDGEDQLWTGIADVTASRNPLARLICRAMRLPAAGRDVAVTVRFERDGGHERWHRSFGGRRYRSTLHAADGLMVERMGPATSIFRVTASSGTLRFDLQGFRFLGVPFPSWLRPSCCAVEREEDGAFVFDIPITLPLFGRVIHYTGHMRRRDD